MEQLSLLLIIGIALVSVLLAIRTVQQWCQDSGEDYEEDGHERTKIRHESGI
jgi:hypothetical protein